MQLITAAATTTRRTLRRLRASGILKPNARAFATHISHEAHGSIAAMNAFAAANNYLLPHDGLDISL